MVQWLGRSGCVVFYILNIRPMVQGSHQRTGDYALLPGLVPNSHTDIFISVFIFVAAAAAVASLSH